MVIFSHFGIFLIFNPLIRSSSFRNTVDALKSGRWQPSIHCLIRFTPCAICSSCLLKIYEVLPKGTNWLIQIEPFWTTGFNSEQITKQKNWALTCDPNNSTRPMQRTSLILSSIVLQYRAKGLTVLLMHPITLIMKMNQSIQRLPTAVAQHVQDRNNAVIRVILTLNLLCS